MQLKIRSFIVLVCLLFALVLGMVTTQILVAGTVGSDLSGSSLSVDKTSTIAGNTVMYTVSINNSGDTIASNVLVTDTLPSELTYQAGSFNSETSGATTLSYGDTGNVITWTGNVDSLGSATLTYSAQVSDSVLVNDIITNTVEITGTGVLLERSAATTIIDPYLMMMPIIFQPVPDPILNPIVGPTGSGNSWTASWNVPAPEVTGYQVQESQTAEFLNPVQFDVGNTTSKIFTYAPSINNIYCYRVRALVGMIASDWSNTQCTVGNYLDDFSNTSSGWAIRQQDTDDTNNSSYYANGEYVVKIGGRWDYALVSPLAQAPKPPYAIETRISFDQGVDNLHGYGIVFGGNWNGQPCPGNDYKNCFTHYYRFLVVWYGPLDHFRIQLKRIDYNDPVDNVARGVSLVDFKDISVGNSKGYNTWRIEVEENGTIRIFLNGNQVASAVDTTYINSPYFGIMASSDEYLGAEPHVDWYRATKQ